LTPRARVALALGGVSDRPYADIARVARLAEDAGYEALFVSETWGRDAFTTLAALARDTRTIRLGTGIVNVYSRSAATLAMAAASIDEISGGRAILGLGSSGKRVIENWHGRERTAPVATLAATVSAVRRLLDGAARDGFSLRIPRKVPVWLASMTQPSLAVVGAVADGWLPYFFAPESSKGDRALVERAIVDGGRLRSDFTVAPYIYAAVAEDEQSSRTILRRHIAFYVGSMGSSYRAQLERHGHAAAVQRIVAAAAAKDHVTARSEVTDELIDRYTLAGPRRDRLDAYRAAGADLPVVALPSALDATTIERTIAAFAP
jgi:alkanesulfonate monooxygenase SsuD/methylene tetrahydromethanopterin reductase-like flavin-dependent oxidoreductase (luciferase family)